MRISQKKKKNIDIADPAAPVSARQYVTVPLSDRQYVSVSSNAFKPINKVMREFFMFLKKNTIIVHSGCSQKSVST